MPSRREVSIFEIIGPIMVGPSSSHTAGAVRLGYMGRTVLGTQPEHARIELHGSFADTGQGHGTDKAVIAGLLGMPPDDDRLKDSFTVAREQGMAFEFVEIDLGEDAHPNTARLTLKAGDAQISLMGASVGGGQIEVTEIDGYRVSFGGEYDTLLVLAEDRPGTVNAITGWLLERQINVAYLRVERQKRGGKAMTIIETDDPLPDEIIEAIEDFNWVQWVRRVPKVDV
jgi:L-serine dehydratase